MAGMQIEVEWLEDGENTPQCPVCMMLLDKPTSGCPEGHLLCRGCYVESLSTRKKCPICNHPTDETKLVRCRPLEDIILQMRVRCKHGLEVGSAPAEAQMEAEGDGEGGGESANLELLHLTAWQRAWRSISEVMRAWNGGDGAADGGGAHAVHEAGQEVADRCSWRGRVCELAGHIAEGCGYEPVECPNSVAGCKESVPRKDVARHASETCAYREAHPTH